MLIRTKQLVTVDIFYYRPDYTNLIQEFIWQTEDTIPELQRVHRFLDHWHRNIDAVIQEVLLSVNDKRIASYKSVDAFLKIN